jgi:hypothetical protein
MKIKNCNKNHTFECPKPNGSFYLVEDGIYLVTVQDIRGITRINLCNVKNKNEHWWCSFKDFRQYLKEGLIKIVG